MRFKIEVHRSFLNELEDAIHWYNRQQPGLGRRFGNTVKQTVETLKGFPYSEIRYGNVRCRQVAKFPYLLHFTVDSDQKLVRLFGIRHTSQDPKRTWKDES